MSGRAGGLLRGKVSGGSRGGVSGQGGGLSRADRDFSARPSPRLRNRNSRSVILRLPTLEQRQHMLRTVRCPEREQTMARQFQRSTAMRGNETSVSHRIILCTERARRRVRSGYTP
jgi:hypothetical protein